MVFTDWRVLRPWIETWSCTQSSNRMPPLQSSDGGRTARRSATAPPSAAAVAGYSHARKRCHRHATGGPSEPEELLGSFESLASSANAVVGAATSRPATTTAGNREVHVHEGGDMRGPFCCNFGAATATSRRVRSLQRPEDPEKSRRGGAHDEKGEARDCRHAASRTRLTYAAPAARGT